MDGLLLYDIHGKTFSGPSSEFSLVILSEVPAFAAGMKSKDLFATEIRAGTV